MGKNENVAAAPSEPQARPSRRAPMACAASSRIGMPRGSQTARSPSIGAGWPYRCTATTARVRAVIAASTAAGSSWKPPPASMSTKTGVAPAAAIDSGVAKKV